MMQKKLLNMFQKAFTQSNTVKGFKATYIYPVNKNMLREEKNLNSSVADRPIHSIE